MTITTQAKWSTHSVHRGVAIYRRSARTGTSGGQWLAAGCYYDTLKKAVAGIDAIPEMNLQHYLQNRKTIHK